MGKEYAYITGKWGDAGADQKARLAYLTREWADLPNFYDEGGRGLSGLAANIGVALLDPLNVIGGVVGGLVLCVFLKSRVEGLCSVNSRDIDKVETACGDASLGDLETIPKQLPGLLRAQKLQKIAAKEGFDWDRIEDVLLKLDEEIFEFKEAVQSGKRANMESEFGDLLFVMANIARHITPDAPQVYTYLAQALAALGEEDGAKQAQLIAVKLTQDL